MEDGVSDMVQGKFGSETKKGTHANNKVANLFAVLAAAHPEWVPFCSTLQDFNRYQNFSTSATVFNIVLDGVVHRYGSAVGRKLVATFWPSSLRNAQKDGIRQEQDDAGELKMQPKQDDAFVSSLNLRNVVNLSTEPERKLIIYGALEPSVATIRIILSKAVEEMAGSGTAVKMSLFDAAGVAFADEQERGPTRDEQENPMFDTNLPPTYSDGQRVVFEICICRRMTSRQSWINECRITCSKMCRMTSRLEILQHAGKMKQLRGTGG